jgi:uncharacterized membrane protein
MKTRLIYLWDALHTSYWFIPTLMALGGAGLSLLTAYLDHQVKERRVQAVGR